MDELDNLHASESNGFQGCSIDDYSKVTYLSHDGVTTIHAYVWVPGLPDNRTPRGVVQIIHGFSEHSLRYGYLVEFLTSLGFIVCSNDHLGHGKTGECAQGYGVISALNASEILVQDVKTLHDWVFDKLECDAPYIVIGCSSGTFIARSYAARYSDEIAGLILVGVSHIPTSAIRPLLKFSNFKTKLTGPTSKNGLANYCILGQYDQSLEDSRNNFGWHCSDQAVVEEYRNDIRCGFKLSAAGCKAFYELALDVDNPDTIAAMRLELPVLFLSGAKDPVGDRMIGEISVSNSFIESGMTKVSALSYEDMLHDIFHEPKRNDVFDDVQRWLKECTVCDI